MAQGSIRIVRDTAGGAGSSAGETPAKGGLIITPDNSADESTTSVPTVQQSGARPATNRKPKHSETKRTTLSVEDRDGVASSEVGRKVQPNRTTPAPPKSDAPAPGTARVYNRTRKRYMVEAESKQTASFLLSAVEMVGVTAAGPVGEMTEFERGMITPPLVRILQRTPLGVIEKTTPLIDIAFLVMGGALYFNRVSGGIKFPSKPKTKGVQEDTRAPQAAPVEHTVTRTAGDVDGIAQPVPSAITAYMNGAI